MGLLRQARPIMNEIVKTCHESSYVTVMRKGQVVPLDMVESDQPVRIISHIGEGIATPLHCSRKGPFGV